MYGKSGAKLDPRSITLQRLIDDNFTRCHSTIMKIFSDAKAEFNIEKEIEKIDNALEKITIKSVLFEQGEKHTFPILKDVSSILIKLDDQHSLV